MTNALSLVDVERRLGLFALAIAGRPYHVRSEEDLHSGVLVHRSGLPLSDGETLYLPGAIDTFPLTHQNLGAFRLMALHQLGYREFGTLAVATVEARRRIAALAALPMPEPAPREPELSLLFRHFRWPAFARALFTVFEGARIDARMLAAYPGVRHDWERSRGYERVERPLPARCATAVDYVEALIGWTLGHERAALTASDATGALDAIIAYASIVTAGGADVYASVAAVTHAYALVESLGLIAMPADSGDNIELDASETFPAPPTFHGEAPGEWQQREERLERWDDDLATMDRGLAAAMAHGQMSTRTGDGEIREGKPIVSRGDRDLLARRVEMERASVRRALAREDRAAGPSFLYDEWDMHQGRYLRGWCRLYEAAIAKERDADVAALLARVAPLRLAVQRRFAEIRPRGYSPVRRVLDGDELDLEELLDYYVETKRGNEVDARVYRRRDRRARDVAAAFLLDLSASTDDPIHKMAPEISTDVDLRCANLRDPFDDDYTKLTVDPGPPPRRVIDVLRESLLLMASALEHHRDHWGLYGFSGYGRENVEYYVVKELGARFGYTTLAALASLRPRRSTRMGPAIRHSMWKLARTASPLKVLIVVSDGFPQDCDYGPDRADHEYGVVDTAKALEEAARAGIETFCVTVDRAGHDYLKRMCAADRYLVIDEIEALPLELTKVYQKLTSA